VGLKLNNNMKTLNFKAVVNPFMQECILKVKYNKKEHEIKMFYNSIDEWSGFEINDMIFDIHFHYDEKFTVNIYRFDKDSDAYKYPQKVKLSIKIKD
jgi:PAB1-binding protein PBP1